MNKMNLTAEGIKKLDEIEDKHDIEAGYLPEAGASAERISSVVRCCQNSEDILKETIENALYSTGNFTIEHCTDLAEGLILFIRDSFKNKSAIAHNEYGLTAVRQH